MSSTSTSTSSKSGGLFHSIKKLFSHPAKTSDPIYDNSLENFNKLNNTIYRIKNNLHTYTQSMQQLFISSNAVTIDLGSLIEEKAGINNNTNANENNNPTEMAKQESSQTKYNELVELMREKHHELVSEKSHNLSTSAAIEVLKKLDDEIDTYKGIQARISMREQIHGDLDYYSKKVEKLQQERDKKVHSDGAESTKENEKFQRNQQKLAEQQKKFAPYNQELIADMDKVWANRKLILGPALNCFAKLERDSR